MELQKLGVEIREAILEAMIESIESEETRACATIDTDDGYFDVSTNEDDEKDCCVWHDNDKSKSSPNLERWAESIIPDWADAADEADWRHDDDEDDIDWRNDGLDPAFSSWEEVNAMFFRRY